MKRKSKIYDRNKPTLKCIENSISLTFWMILVSTVFINFSYSQIAEFEGKVRSTDGTPEYQLYDDASSEQRIEGKWRENNNDLYFESLFGSLYLGADTSGLYKQRLYISGENSDIGVRITPKETCANTDVNSLGLTIRRNAFSTIFAGGEGPKKSNAQGGDCFFDSNDRKIEVFPDNYSNNLNITSSLGLPTKKWDLIYSNQNYTDISRPGDIRFSGVNSGLGDGLADDGVIYGPFSTGADIFARVNDAFVIRIDDNNNNQGNFVVSSASNSDIFRANTNGNIYARYLPAGDRANMQYEVSTGRFFYDNSSARYKENITPLSVDFNKILEAQPVTYTRPGEPNIWEVGYVAEDMDRLGLEELLFRNEEGQVENFNYEKMILYVVEVLKTQDAINKDQNVKIKKLEEENKILLSELKK